MSGPRAVAAVTTVVKLLVEAALGKKPDALSNVDVTTVHPQVAHTAQDERARVNVYCYQCVPSTAVTWAPQVAYGKDGRASATVTAVVVDARYLLTFHGSDTDLVPQHMFAKTLAALNARPILTKGVASQLTANLDSESAARESLEAAEGVRLTPLTLTLEELSHLWSILGVPYQLSLTYQATGIVLAATEPAEVRRGAAQIVVAPNLQPPAKESASDG